MPYLSQFLTVVVVHLLAVMSPGPDFILVSRNAMAISRRIGVFSALGIASGIFVHITYSLIGIALIIAKSAVIFSVIKYFGAAYLVFIGWQCLRAQKKNLNLNETQYPRVLSAPAAVRMGFLTNVLNPKATLFFLALFTQVIAPNTPKIIQALYGLEMAVATFTWFAMVAVVVSHDRVRGRFASIQHRLEQAFGVVLVFLAIKVILG